jgi:hypothetical protein
MILKLFTGLIIEQKANSLPLNGELTFLRFKNY